MTSFDRATMSDIIAKDERLDAWLKKSGLADVYSYYGLPDRFIGWQTQLEAPSVTDVANASRALTAVVEPLMRALSTAVEELDLSSDIRSYPLYEIGFRKQNRVGARVQILLCKGSYYPERSDVFTPYIVAFHDRWSRTIQFHAWVPNDQRGQNICGPGLAIPLDAVTPETAARMMTHLFACLAAGGAFCGGGVVYPIPPSEFDEDDFRD